MKISQLLMLAAAGCITPLFAEVPELLKLVPEAKGYELIYRFNPKNFKGKGYQTDRSEELSGKLTRLGYLLKLTGNDGKESWVFAEMDPFTQDLAKVGVPASSADYSQCYVNNLTVAGNKPGIKTGKFDKGNIEFWAGNYGGGNSKNIPGATGAYDFGDDTNPKDNSGYGSMQVHNYLNKQTVFAFNNFGAQGSCDLGIGNNLPAKPGDKVVGHPDWTFSNAAKNIKNAEMFVVGKFDNLKLVKPNLINPEKVTFAGKTGKAFFNPGEEMVFMFLVDVNGQKPDKPLSIAWTRTGDDGKRAYGKEVVVPGKPVVVKTKLDKPGFVRMQARLVDHKSRTLTKKQGGQRPFVFDGGAGVEPEKLQGSPEPADFDAFWDKQKKRLAAVPLKFKMDKVSKPGAKVDVYAVSVDCAGPRPVTGFLMMPAGAKDKSLPARVSFHGYGTGIQRAPGWNPGNTILFDVNAHGYDLNKDNAYYQKFFNGIKSNGQIYAFDKKQNSDPEKAYFNGMALRLMRAIQFVKALPQWNGKDLTASGGSQGGLQAIWAAALDHDVKICYSDVTWCCDFAGPKKNARQNGWRPEYVPALEYYDAAHLAKRIPKTCFVTITRAGLGDYVCPPSGITVLYNNLTAPKKIIYVQGSDHGYVPPKAERFIKESK